MKVHNDGISRGHNTKILKLESVHSVHSVHSVNSLRSNVININPRDSSQSHSIKKKLTDYFIFSNSSAKQQLTTSLPDKKSFLEEIGKIRINQKLSHIFPESKTPSNKYNPVRKSFNSKIIEGKQENKITIMDLNPLVVNTTEENVSSGIVYDQPALDDYFYNKENKYNYIESLSKESVLKAAPTKMVNEKFKKLQKKMSKFSNFEENSYNYKDYKLTSECGVQIPTNSDCSNINSFNKKPKDKITNLNLRLNLDKNRNGNLNEEAEGNIINSPKSRFKNSLLRSCLEGSLEDEQTEHVFLPSIESRGLSQRSRMRHLIGKNSKLKRFLKNNHFKRISL
jgi:hypothetical protein